MLLSTRVTGLAGSRDGGIVSGPPTHQVRSAPISFDTRLRAVQASPLSHMSEEPKVELGVAQPAGPGSAVPATETERALLEGVLAGDRKAIGRFVSVYSDRIYRYVKPRLDRQEAADDLVQEVFLAAWQRLHDFRGGSELGTWLIGIARHKLADYYRERFRMLLPLDEEGEDTAPVVALPSEVQLNARLDERTIRTRIERVLRELDSVHRAVLCVFERAVQILRLGHVVDSLNYCRVCHARLLAESVEGVPLAWRHCPYAEFQKK